MKKVRFTQDFIDKIPVPISGRVYFKDDSNTGLALYKTSNGSVTFFTRKRINGRDRKLTIGKYPDIKLEIARKQSTILRGKAELGGDPIIEKQREKKNNITFQELFDRYIERHSKLVKKSWIYDKREVELHLTHLYKKKLSEINKSDVIKIHEDLKINSGLYQANRILERIRAMYNKAIEWGYEGKNPATGIKKYREKSRDRFIQPREMPHLIESINNDENNTFRDLFLFLLLTGVRKMNAQMMRWEDIIWERCEWRMPDTKNGDPLTIPLSQKALEILNNRGSKKTSRWVFPQDNDPEKHIINLKRGWKRILERASLDFVRNDLLIGEWVREREKKLSFLKCEEIYRELKRQAKRKNIEWPNDLMDIRIHDIRRTFGSYQALTGASLQIIGKSLGHKSQQATQVYARLNLDPVRASIEKATEVMFGG